MVDIQSKEVIDKISDDLKVQPSMQIPRELAKQIQLVYNVNPERMIQVRSGTTSDSTTSTIHTTHATKRTFLIAAQLAYAKDVLAQSVNSQIQCTPLNSVANIFILIRRYEPLTAGDGSIQLKFPIPIELEKGSAVKVNNSNATASIDASGIIFFYEVDPL